MSKIYNVKINVKKYSISHIRKYIKINPVYIQTEYLYYYIPLLNQIKNNKTKKTICQNAPPKRTPTAPLVGVCLGVISLCYFI